MNYRTVFLNHVYHTIHKYKMVSAGEKVLVGVSGGPDSTALVHALWHLRGKLKISMALAHLNHGFRGSEADREEEFAIAIGTKLRIESFSEKAEVLKYKKKYRLSKQTAARAIRYDFFYKTASKMGAEKIALGHTSDDQAETVLMRILRGTGTLGLGGIPPVRDANIVRPFIEMEKREIIRFLQEEKIDYVEDPSNFDCCYTRNKIRHNLLPLLVKEYNPNVVRSLNTLSVLTRSDEDYLMDITAGEINDIKVNQRQGFIEFDLNAFSSRHIALKRRIMREAIRQVKGNIERIGDSHIECLIELAGKKGTGKRLNLPCGITALTAYGAMKIYRGMNSTCPAFDKVINIPGTTVIPEAELKIQVEIINPDDSRNNNPETSNKEMFDIRVSDNGLRIRNRRRGDVFYPDGMEGRKKLKNFFIDKKIPRGERDKIPLLVSAKDILWVVGQRRSSIGKVTVATKKTLRIEVATQVNRLKAEG